MPRMTALHMLRSTIETVSAPASSSSRDSLPHPTQPLCTLRVRRHRRLTQHSLPGGLLSLTWAGLAPADRASFAWRLRCGRDASYLAPLAQIRTCGFPAYGSHLGYRRQRFAVCEPAPLTRLCGFESGACFADPHSPWSPPLAPLAPQRIAPLCSPASQLLWRSPTSRARASSATAPRLLRRRPDVVSLWRPFSGTGAHCSASPTRAPDPGCSAF